MRWMAVLVLAISAGAGAAKPVESWGKPGVGFDAYRADAVACATAGYYRDVSQDEPARIFLRGFQTADDALNGAGGANSDAWINAVRRTQPNRRLREVQAIQTGDVERCLAGRGYARFALTREEARMLGRYPVGSEGRHRYLHALATAERDGLTRTK